MIPEDDIVAEVRATRAAILAEFNHDLAAYMEDVMRRQEQLRREGWVFIDAPSAPDKPAAGRDAA